MMMNAVKHFVLVGLLAAFAAGWFLTLVVNFSIGMALEESGQPPGESYTFALVTTATSITLIGVSIFVGNWLYRRRFGTGSLTPWGLVVSTLLFLVTVYPIILPQLAFALDKISSHLSYAYNNPAEVAKLLSLPLLRLVFLPVCYVIAGRMLMPGTREGGAGSRETKSEGA